MRCGGHRISERRFLQSIKRRAHHQHARAVTATTSSCSCSTHTTTSSRAWLHSTPACPRRTSPLHRSQHHQITSASRYATTAIAIIISLSLSLWRRVAKSAAVIHHIPVLHTLQCSVACSSRARHGTAHRFAKRRAHTHDLFKITMAEWAARAVGEHEHTRGVRVYAAPARVHGRTNSHKSIWRWRYGCWRWHRCGDGVGFSGDVVLLSVVEMVLGCCWCWLCSGAGGSGACANCGAKRGGQPLVGVVAVVDFDGRGEGNLLCVHRSPRSDLRIVGLRASMFACHSCIHIHK